MASNTNNTPLGKLFALLNSLRREIWYIMIYASIAGIISLSLPLGIQSMIGFVSSGQVSTSVVVLIAFILIGIMVTGGLTIMQLYLVEHIQQKLYASTAFEFAHRVPKMRLESLMGTNPPELMNRFFDIISLQKGIAKMLIDFSAALLQIIFGLILLSFYHPYFIFFGIFLVAILILVIRFTGPQGLKSSLTESKYKYQMANWLQQMAKSIRSFKIMGNSSLGLSKTDYFVSQYLQARKEHFKVLVTQYLSFVGFKTFITGGLLVLGCILVINQEINIGQFVASEIIIILMMAAVEKLLVKLDVVYDVLTSLEKLDQVRQVPLEEERNITLDHLPAGQHVSIELKNLSYRSKGSRHYDLHNLNLQISPGNKISISGTDTSGKMALIQILLGLLQEYEGVVAINTISMRDINRESLHEYTANNSEESLFDGTLLENIQMNRSNISLHDVIWALDMAGLTEYVQELPNGLETYLSGGGAWLPESIVQQLILARIIAEKPRLLILDNLLDKAERKLRKQVLGRLTGNEFNSTIIFFSNDPDILSLCDQIFVMKDGVLSNQTIPEADELTTIKI
ncbi:ATP-binding cassette domain-containing protein [Rhodocytophaga rosea]|uniref:ATP-binding cassette domain-containing protein n=1 Tax=Rhodocytophaga rosea TaxID=2704465 RepID=A0A6C0GN24_9BACT|nr:ABC transporter transmembrane domain-containing protein [Rhodocytophaga rosea]QHT69436.1 ATP-binding cassette domain-containing protein [Rhodocytophaga rosea]